MILFDRSTAFILGMFCLWFGMCLAQVLVYFVLRHINARDLVHTALIMTGNALLTPDPHARKT